MFSISTRRERLIITFFLLRSLYTRSLRALLFIFYFFTHTAHVDVSSGFCCCFWYLIQYFVGLVNLHWLLINMYTYKMYILQHRFTVRIYKNTSVQLGLYKNLHSTRFVIARSCSRLNRFVRGSHAVWEIQKRFVLLLHIVFTLRYC